MGIRDRGISDSCDEETLPRIRPNPNRTAEVNKFKKEREVDPFQFKTHDDDLPDDKGSGVTIKNSPGLHNHHANGSKALEAGAVTHLFIKQVWCRGSSTTASARIAEMRRLQ